MLGIEVGVAQVAVQGVAGVFHLRQAGGQLLCHGFKAWLQVRLLGEKLLRPHQGAARAHAFAFEL